MSLPVAEEYIFEFARAQQADDPYAFRFLPQTYLLRTSGGGVETADFPWDPAFLQDLGTIRLPGCDPAVVQRVGQTLRRFLIALGFAEYEARIVDASQAGRQVLLTFRSAAAELYALPWELLTLKSSGGPVGALPSVLIRYEWPETQTTAESPAPRRELGRVLLAWSAAAGAVPAREHAQAIEAACRAGSLAFKADTDILPHVSCERLLAALEAARAQDQPVAVLHLLCHGGAAGTTFGLLFDGEQPGDAAVVVDAGRLRQLLAPFSATIRLVVLAACDSGNSGTLGNALGSVAQALHRAGFAHVVASRYPLSVAASVRLTETLYQELIVQQASLEQALLRTRERLSHDATQRDWASLQLYSRSADGHDSRPVIFRPFRGLLAFQPQHSRFFFGRDAEIKEIVAALGALTQTGRPRFLIVAGASGSGKSSVVLAGVVPRLTASGTPRLSVMRPGTDPLRALDAALGTGDAVLLVVDQLEEIFTQVSDPATRQQFVQRLWQLAADQTTQNSVIATLRVDFLGECGAIPIDALGHHLDSVAYDAAHRVFIAQLGPEALRAAIEGPAHRVGITLESGLMNRMLEAVGAEPGSLPLLEYTLDLLWLRRAGQTLTQAGYDAVGQVTGALSQHAETLLGRMGEAEQRLARRLLVRLVHVGNGVAHNTRQRVPIKRLRLAAGDDAARFDRVLADLVDARLLLRSEDEQDQTAEVAHEALIRRWPRMTKWLHEDRNMLAELEKLEALLVQWRQHKALLSGGQLSFAQEVARSYPADLPDEARALLQASQKREQDRQKRQRQWLWVKRLATGGLLVTTIVLGVNFSAAYRDNLRAEFARRQLVDLITRTSRQPSPAELLRTLARLRLELELNPELALEASAQAAALEPPSPGLLADRAEYLLAAGRLDQVSAIAETAYQADSAPAARLRIAVVAWSAARLAGDRATQARWVPRVQAEYDRLPAQAHLQGLAGTTQILLKTQSLPRAALPLPDVLAVYALLHLEKSPNNATKLGRMLKYGD